MTVPGGVEASLATRVGDRFWSKVAKSGPDDCWLWTACRDKDGYGRLSIKGIPVKSATISVELDGRRVWPGSVVDHECNNPPCVNPRHLAVTTQGHNVLRSETAPSAINARKTHCHRGHPFSPENTRTYPGRRGKPVRACLACERLRDSGRNR